MPKKTPAMSAPRQARVDAWKPFVDRSGLSLAAMAEATGIGQGRVMRILRLGAVEDACERERLADVLGREPS